MHETRFRIIENPVKIIENSVKIGQKMIITCFDSTIKKCARRGPVVPPSACSDVGHGSDTW